MQSRNLTFIQPSAVLGPSSSDAKRCRRRSFPSRRDILIGSAASIAASTLQPFQGKAEEEEVPPKPSWSEDELCYVCAGHGQVPCMLCEGSGTFVVDDGVVVDRAQPCPSCGGSGTIGALNASCALLRTAFLS